MRTSRTVVCNLRCQLLCETNDARFFKIALSVKFVSTYPQVCLVVATFPDEATAFPAFVAVESSSSEQKIDIGYVVAL